MPQIALSQALLDEVVPLTIDLVRARPDSATGQPLAKQARVLAIVAARLRQAGIAVTVVPLSANDSRSNLLAVLPGTDRTQAPLLLLGHSDVATADEGAVRGDRLIGRGAADALSLLALQTLTMGALAEAQASSRRGPRPRDVMLLVTGDAQGDDQGLQQALVDWPAISRAAYALGGGGHLLESYWRPGEDLAAIAAADKGLFQFTLEASGPHGPAATPAKETAPDRMTRALSRIIARASPFRWTRASERLLYDVGEARGGVEGVVLKSPTLAGAFAKEMLEATPASAALYRDTCALTVMQAGRERSTIPARAHATFDCRLLPGTKPAAFHDEILRTINDPRIAVTVLAAAAASASDPDGAVPRALRRRMQRELPSAVVAATLTTTTTNCPLLRAAGVPCYGFLPVRITKEQLDALHSDDESVRLDELGKGLGRLVDVAAALAWQ